jgi:pSer/pThr/pTyr-binding forkhead associated (FHA) protein
MGETIKGLAKVSWLDPETREPQEYVLTEGATITIGRSRNNEVCIPEQHVSRQHAVIAHQYGVFMISDLGSANGTFVNDQQLMDPFPLAHGDVIRLYVPIVNFSAIVTPEDEKKAIETGSFIVAMDKKAPPRLSVTSGPQEGIEFTIPGNSITLGRAVANATWEIRLEDRAVSRPHARIEKHLDKWMLIDLGSANGTTLNGKTVGPQIPHELNDGDVVQMGQTKLLFRLGG